MYSTLATEGEKTDLQVYRCHTLCSVRNRISFTEINVGILYIHLDFCRLHVRVQLSNKTITL